MKISAKELASLPIWPDFNVSQINRLCREGKIFAYKTDQGPFASWIIPIESITAYIICHPSYLKAISDANTEGMREEDMKLLNHLKKYCCKSSDMVETYTVQQLSMIFDAPVNQVAKWFGARVFLFAFFTMREEVSSITVSNFLENHSERLKMLQERHKLLLAKGDMEMEEQIRHLLMLHAFYKLNGQLD